jgi:hypothetical protein
MIIIKAEEVARLDLCTPSVYNCGSFVIFHPEYRLDVALDILKIRTGKTEVQFFSER